jgi:ribosomal-protein-alanine acetyltransferase
VPTLESAGTNVKVLEALAMRRAVVSTSSGCAGLGLQHSETAWIADSPADFALGIRTLLGNLGLRHRIAADGRLHAEKHFDWRTIGRRQRALFRELLGDPLILRRATPDDLAAIDAIQNESTMASRWTPESYLGHDCRVAVAAGTVVGFVVSRHIGPHEREILNLAVDRAWQRTGVARRLFEEEFALAHTEWFLEVRESNAVAIHFYKSLGFREAGRREGYYHDPLEAAIVMRVFS